MCGPGSALRRDAVEEDGTVCATWRAYAVYSLELSPMGNLTVVQVGWTVALALVTVGVACAVTQGGRWVHRVAVARPFIVPPRSVASSPSWPSSSG